MSIDFSGGYAGDVSVTDAYATLEKNKSAILIDVRSKAEWSYVGVPDLSEIGKETILLEWQEYPTMKVAADFAPRLIEILRARGAPPEAPLLFLCRSGARSRAAAMAMTEAGRENCFNIRDGFEGPLDDKRQRGAVSGWKASGLPWAQS
jgi:rhodanese-related sulfurtransferase